jgi:serine/threonine protein phosphatase PrpC
MKGKNSVMPENTDADTAHSSPSEQAKPCWGSISSRTNVDLDAFSHKGKVRQENEDSFLVTRFERSLATLLTNLPTDQIPDHYSERGYAMFVADGIGGRTSGEVASRTAISALIDLIIQTPDWIMHPDDESALEVLRRMEERFGQLPDALARRAQTDIHLSRMGTTLTLAVSLGPDLVIAHVGASRAYLFRHGQLLHLTNDQTIAQVLVDTGIIRPEEVAMHHTRRMLTSAIMAAGEKADVELHHLKLMDGDRLLLCSDGLTEMLTDEKISAVLEKAESAAAACRALVDLALEAGGNDNITVVLARYQIPEAND